VAWGLEGSNDKIDAACTVVDMRRKPV
jgi:hypothetical protein